MHCLMCLFTVRALAKISIQSMTELENKVKEIKKNVKEVKLDSMSRLDEIDSFTCVLFV